MLLIAYRLVDGLTRIHIYVVLTENGDAAADTYDSDAGCCRLRRRRALSTGGHSASWSLLARLAPL